MPDPSTDLRDRIARSIYGQGAYCGDCEYDGWDSCEDCRRCVLGYADVVLGVLGDLHADCVPKAEREQAIWHAYFNVHGDPFVVADPERANTTIIATVSTSPDDYGRGNALLLASAPALRAENERLRKALALWQDFAMEAGSMYESTLRYEIPRVSRRAKEAAESGSSEETDDA